MASTAAATTATAAAKKRGRSAPVVDHSNIDDGNAEADDDFIDESMIDASMISEAAASLGDDTPMMTDAEIAAAVPSFPALTATQIQRGTNKVSYIRIGVPPHRLTPLKQNWLQLYTPIVEHMKLQIRYNTKKRSVEVRTTTGTQLQSALTKAADFIRAFMLGFEVRDCIALLRLDDLYVDSFEIKDVKTLEGEHLSRAIGRIAGVGGKTKYTIENATKTRVVLADTHIHLLGSFTNINIAKNAIVRLIMGSPPGKVYNQMRSVATRAKERF